MRKQTACSIFTAKRKLMRFSIVKYMYLWGSVRHKLAGQIKMKGYTLMPLKVYFKGSLVKVEIGLARGKKLYDKRQDIAKKDAKREAERDFKIRNLG